jgi:polyferredoxin
MANRKALVVRLDRSRLENCIDCHSACDNACPMRLKPRAIKRRMFTCTQCARCIQTCDQVMARKVQPGLLQWVAGQAALEVSDREFGRNDRKGHR